MPACATTRTHEPRRSLCRRELLLTGLYGALGCGPRRIAAPPSAPPVASGFDFIPPDLDVVARCDLGRLRSVVGQAELERRAETLLRQPALELDAPLLIDSLLVAEVAWLAYRPGAVLEPLDRVLALEGRFEPLRSALAGFGAAHDLGGDLRVWEARRAPQRRGDIARIYALGTRVRAFVSEAEIDALELLLDRGPAAATPRPPEQGTLSLAARPEVLARFVDGAELRRILKDARELSLRADLDSSSISVRLALELGSDDDAERLSRVARQVLEPLLERRGLRHELEHATGRLTLRMDLDRAWLDALGG